MFDIRKARKRLRMTQEQLADALGMKTNSIARMERGERPVMPVTVLAIKYLLLTKATKEK
jgi:transcriptional regulator with XRE-family HTH domain